MHRLLRSGNGCESEETKQDFDDNSSDKRYLRENEQRATQFVDAEPIMISRQTRVNLPINRCE